MRITELFTAKSIELDSAASNRDEILSRLVELQATHGNITDTEAYKKALYAREDEASTLMWTTASPFPTPRRMWSPGPAWPPCV